MSNKLKSIEGSMNEIIEKYTDYKIQITYETDDTTINIKAYNKVTAESLSLERLSTYETLMLSIGWKSALSTQTLSTKGNLFIMDESVECMDKENFENNLDTILKSIVNTYGKLLIISQRDITSVSDNEIIIEKQNGMAQIKE